MVKRFYLTGHHTFSNRGCEAIVRSTAQLLREQFGDVEVFVPSSDIVKDRELWPSAEDFGVKFVPAYLPVVTRYWTHLQQLPIPLLKRAIWPFPLPQRVRETIEGVDCVLSVGGDNYSLDYLLPSLLMGVNRCAMDLGTPVVLWGASVGPFERELHFLPVIRRHLGRMTLIAARESATVEYLTKLGLGDKVIQAADPAFGLAPEHVSTVAFWPQDRGEGVLGFNASPLLLRYHPSSKSQSTWLDEVAGFIRYSVVSRKLGVLLVPHVIPHNGIEKNNDAAFLGHLLERLGNLGNHVRLMSSRLNAVETKYVISQCRFFIGARTHSTIASLSSGVPTTSISYSVKSEGINRDLFGHTRYVLDNSEVVQTSLIERLNQLMQEEDGLQPLLKQKTTEMIERTKLAMRKVAEVLDDNGG